MSTLKREKSDNNLNAAAFNVRNDEGAYSYNVPYIFDKMISYRSSLKCFLSEPIVLEKPDGWSDFDGVVYIYAESRSEWSDTLIIVSGWVPVHICNSGAVEVFEWRHGSKDDMNAVMSSLEIYVQNKDEWDEYAVSQLINMSADCEDAGFDMLHDQFRRLISAVALKQIINVTGEHQYDVPC